MKKFFSILISLLMTLSIMDCFAESNVLKSDFVLSTKSDGVIRQTIKVSGSVTEAAGKMINLKVWKNGKSASDFIDDSSAEACIAAIGQTLADEDGNFSFTFSLTEANNPYGTDGKYSVEVKVEDIDIKINQDIYIANLALTQGLIDDVNNENDLAAMGIDDFKVVLDDGANYGIQTSIYDQLSSDPNVLSITQTNIINSIKSELVKKEASGAIITIENLSEIVNNSVILETFKRERGQILMNTIEEYEDYLGLDNLSGAENIYATYEALENKTVALGKIGTQPTIASFIESFKDNVFVQAIAEAEYWSDLKSPIDMNNDYLNLGDEYIKFKSDSDRYEEMLKYIIVNKSSVTSVSTFKTLFSKAGAAYEKSPDDNSKGNGGSKPSSSVSVGGGVTDTTNVPAIPVKPVVSDISGHWGQKAVEYLIAADIVSGRPDGSFGPDENISREEFTKLVVLTFNLYDEGSQADFLDVSKDRWSYSYIASAVKNSVVNGDGAGLFNPNEKISREDMAVILYRAYQRTIDNNFRGELEVKFTDFDSVSDYAKNSVAMLSNMNLISGDGEKFNPHSNATRAEAAQILYNVLKREE